MDVVGLHRNNISKDYQDRGFDECLISIGQRLHCLYIFVRTFSRKHISVEIDPGHYLLN